MITLYCGLNEHRWNHHPVAPGRFACVAPVYGKTTRTKTCNAVTVPPDVQVLQDSGAFSDGPTQRLSLEAALERQLVHAERYGYAAQVTHRASYDVLIDEKWSAGIRRKARWSEQDAQEAVALTVKAAAYLTHRRYGVSAVLSAQGVSAQQYLVCVQQLLPLMQESDVLGLGGFCITGKLPAQIMPVFREIISVVIPFLGREQVKCVHIWGVCYAKALGELLYLCDEQGIALSTDSSGPSLKPAMGEWGYAEWRDPSYIRPPVESRGLERARHVQATREWLARFRETVHYRPVNGGRPSQLRLW